MTVIQSYCGNHSKDSTEYSYHAAHPPCEHRDGPCESCIELAEIEAEIEDLHSRLKDFHERHRQTRTRRNLVHNGPLIHQLPPEIVIHIFALAFPSREVFNCHNPGNEVGPLIPAQVCQTWRELALSTPQLWTSISVDAEEPNLSLLNTHFTHSGMMPLSIHLFALSGNPSTLSKKVMTSVVKQLHRTSSLCLILPDEFLTEFSSISVLDSPNEAPFLEELHVHGRTEDRFLRLKLAIERPHPRRVLLEWLRWDQIYLDWRNISHLTLKSCDVGGVLSEILASKDLKHLALEVGNTSMIREPEVIYPSIEELTIGNLSSAQLMFTDTISLPSLRNLEIKVEEKCGLYPKIVGFLHRSLCPLQVLIIHHWGKDTFRELGEASMRGLIDILESMNTLQHLTVYSYEGFPTSCPLPLIRRLSLQESDFLPFLQTLSLRTRFPLPIDLLFDVMATDRVGPSSTIASRPDTMRPLRELNLELWMSLFEVGPFSQNEVVQILRLRAAGNTISIRCSVRWDLPELEIDVVEFWKCKYGL